MKPWRHQHNHPAQAQNSNVEVPQHKLRHRPARGGHYWQPLRARHARTLTREDIIGT
jgi:hypothetical protein